MGEARPSEPQPPEIGHGALAEKALVPVLIPPWRSSPYAIRLVSEVVSSNGSTSQGSICGSTLALMDAGVPIKAPVAGISCGLIPGDDGSFTTFIDIQGVEDFFGEMDFKVGGTKQASPPSRWTLRTTASPRHHQGGPGHHRRRPEGHPGRDHAPLHPRPRPQVSEYAPKMLTMKIDPDKIREVIGSGGKVIQKITAESGAKIDIEDDGTIYISAETPPAATRPRR